MDNQDRGGTDPDPKTTDRHPQEVAPEATAGRPRQRGGRHRYEDRHARAAAYRARAPGGWAESDATGAWPETSSTGDRWNAARDDTGEWSYQPDPHEQRESDGSSRGDGTTDTGEWDRPSDTGEWDRTSETGEWARTTDTGEWRQLTDTGEWSRDDPAAPRQVVGEGDQHVGHGERNSFWEGIRLAGDDPRWMPTPASAPRSPAVGDFVLPDAPPVPLEPRLADTGPPGHRARRDPDAALVGTLRAMLYAAAWYVVPLLAIFVWTLTLDGNAPAGCVTDAGGGGCESERAEAITSIVDAAPRFVAAIGASLAAVLLLRWVSRGWQVASVSLAAAVIGGGMSIVFFHLLYG
ncbi:MAG TPA: hypothetical protein VFX60_16065 [Micromonospora sp.]|nr:hypothetical protein [Micromonospora sp.]